MTTTPLKPLTKTKTKTTFPKWSFSHHDDPKKKKKKKKKNAIAARSALT